MEYVFVCPACQLKMGYVTTIHMKEVHGISSKEEFYEKYGKPQGTFIDTKTRIS